MPYKEKEIVKVQYDIRRVTKLLKIPASKIKYWTQVFSIPCTVKPRSRKYSEGAFRSLRNIKRLHDTKEYSLLGIAKKLGLKYLGETVASDPIMSEINEILVDKLVNDYLLDQMERRGGKKISIQKRIYKYGTVTHKFFFKRTNKRGHKMKCYFTLANRNGEFLVAINSLVLVPAGELGHYENDFLAPVKNKSGHCLLKKDIVFGLDSFMSAVTIFNQILCTDFTNTQELQKNHN